MQKLRSLDNARRLPVRAAVVAMGALALAGCNSRNAYVPPPPPKVVVAQPVEKPVTDYLELTGNTQAFASVDLVARVQGFLESIDYVDGAEVKKGTQLFGIERDTYQQQLDQANATVASDEATEEYNKAEYQRQATLARQDFASQATMQEWKSKADQAAADVLNAKAAIELAKINLGYTNVQAPFDGTVTNHLVDVGGLVGFSGPTKLATIIQTDPLYVYFTMSEPQILEIKRNLAEHGVNLRTSNLSDVPVEIGLHGEEGYPHKAHLDYASPQVDFATGTLTARALLRQQGSFAPARALRACAHADLPPGEGASDEQRGDRDKPGGELRAGGRPRQRRSEEGGHDGSARRRAPGDRIGLDPGRLGSDRRDSARFSRRQGRSATNHIGAGRKRVFEFRQARRRRSGREVNLRGKRP